MRGDTLGTVAQTIGIVLLVTAAFELSFVLGLFALGLALFPIGAALDGTTIGGRKRNAR